MAAYTILKRGAIYRIMYSTWKTNPRPVVFILYSSPFKVHALSLNSPEMTVLDAQNFSKFIIRMKTIKGIENWSGRILYRILRQYFPNIVRKGYRTFITSNIGQLSLVSTGIIPADQFTGYEKSSYNENLRRDANLNPLIRTIINTTKTTAPKPPPPKKAPFYVPPNIIKEETIKIINQVNEEEENTDV